MLERINFGRSRALMVSVGNYANRPVYTNAIFYKLKHGMN